MVFVAYLIVAVAFRHFVGLYATSLVVIPTALAGWYFGLAGGVATAGLLTLLDAVLFVGGWHADAGWFAEAMPFLLPQAVATVAVGLAVGAFRDRHLEVVRAREAREAELEELRQTRLAVGRELEERLALAEALSGSERRFRMLSEEALVGVYLIQDGVFQYVNPALARTFGYRPGEIVGQRSPEDLTWPDDRQMVRANIADRLERFGGPKRYQFRGLRKDGGMVPVEVLGQAVDIDGRPAILGTLQDRTRELEAEAELRLRLTALETAPIGIVVVDAEGVIEWANPFMEAVTGYAAEELRSTPMRVFRSGRQDQEFYRSLWETIQAGRSWRGELVNRRKDGSHYVEDERITPVRAPDGTIERYVVIKQDVTDRRVAEDKIRALNEDLTLQLERLTLLHRIDRAITDGSDFETALSVFLDATRTGMGVDAAGVFVCPPDGDELVLTRTLGFLAPPDPFRLRMGDGVAGKAVDSGETRVVRGRTRVLDELIMGEPSTLALEEFETYAATPMLVRGQLRGALFVAHRGDLETPTDWLTYFEGLAAQGAILVDNAGLLRDLRSSNRELRAAYDATIEGWSRALDLRDRETEGHTRRVTDLTLRLARAMGLQDEELVHLRRGALLHDIGKMAIPDSILQKPGELTPEEWVLMRQHTVFARDLLAPIGFLEPALVIPYCHHERWDGTGYPEGLEGEAIPLAARIFAVADVFDALTSDRPYRRAWGREEAMAHIRDGAGSHFDPRVVAAFIALQDEDASRQG